MSIELCQERRGDIRAHGVSRAGPRDDPLQAAAGRDPDGLLRLRSRAARGATRRSTTSSRAIEESQLSKLDMLLNGDPVDALSFITHRDRAYSAREGAGGAAQGGDPAPAVRGPHAGGARAARSSRRRPCEPYRKNVTAKCYGGDITRKRKLLEKQKEGKKRMKSIGSVRSPAGSVHERAEDRGR